MTTSNVYDGSHNYGREEATTYEKLRTIDRIWHIENSFVQRHFDRARPDRILDIPVGTGRFLCYYPAQSDITGIDVSDDMLSVARNKIQQLHLSHTNVTLGNIFDIPFEDKHFDAIVCWRLLHLLPEKDLLPALTELARVLRGSLVIQVFSHGSPVRRLASRTIRFCARATRRMPPQHPLRTSKHIRSFIHTRATLETAFLNARLVVAQRSLIGHYYGHDVYAYVLGHAR